MSFSWNIRAEEADTFGVDVCGNPNGNLETLIKIQFPRRGLICTSKCAGFNANWNRAAIFFWILGNYPITQYLIFVDLEMVLTIYLIIFA